MATGESIRQRGLSIQAARRRRTKAPVTIIQASPEETLPEGRCLAAVRGFSASMRASIIRFSPIAPVRAPTIAMQTHKSWPNVGAVPFANDASTTPIKAKGKANTVWENLIISNRDVSLPQAVVVKEVSIRRSVYNDLITLFKQSRPCITI